MYGCRITWGKCSIRRDGVHRCRKRFPNSPHRHICQCGEESPFISGCLTLAEKERGVELLKEAA